MEATALTDTEIDAFLAEQCGPFGCPDCVRRKLTPEGICKYHKMRYELPEYTLSLDALFAINGPIDKCRDAGWAMDLSEGVNGDFVAVVGPRSVNVNQSPNFHRTLAVAATPARALAEACYLALKSEHR